ncbi:MAG: hypothetical protein AAF211_27870 [Myxococcota bacterium]
MTTFGQLSLANLIRRHPWAEEVLEWHGVTADAEDATLSIEALCWLRGVDPHRLERDLWAADPDADCWAPLPTTQPEALHLAL